jgi:hypothetical protein
LLVQARARPVTPSVACLTKTHMRVLLGQVFMGYQGQPSTKLWVATFVRPCAGYHATVLNTMLYHNVENCVNLLREFEQYTAGHAGHG